jgi:transcriptional regulator with PAS, ATPase and Fis domain
MYGDLLSFRNELDPNLLMSTGMREACLPELTETPRQAKPSVAEWRRRYAADMVGDDPAFLHVLQVLRSVADTHSTVLVTGETGTGKELVASAIHKASRRAEKPFVALNCAAIPDSLIESELFGHTRGAFTGAVAAREGRLLAAHGGTLFLDEIGDMPLAAQAKLLRVLQDKQVTPLGADRGVPVDVRIVAATHRDLEDMVEQGTFRRDLFFRLSVIRVELPALRERQDDIGALARHFLVQTAASVGRTVSELADDAVALLAEHSWPGNVRELANVMERAVVLKHDDGPIEAADITIATKRRFGKGTGSVRAVQPAPVAVPSPPVADGSGDGEGLNLRSAVDNVEQRLIRIALERTAGNRTEAAALLGLNRTTLVEKLRKISG